MAREGLPRYRNKEARILVINTVAFFKVKVKQKYVEAILMFVVSIVYFLLQYGFWIDFNIKSYFISAVFFLITIIKKFRHDEVASCEKSRLEDSRLKK